MRGVIKIVHGWFMWLNLNLPLLYFKQWIKIFFSYIII